MGNWAYVSAEEDRNKALFAPFAAYRVADKATDGDMHGRNTK